MQPSSTAMESEIVLTDKDQTQSSLQQTQYQKEHHQQGL